MRTHVRVTHFDHRGVVTKIEEKWVNVDDLPDATAMTLGVMGLKHLTMKFEDRQVRYSAPEFSCDWCEEYGHKSDDCPHLGDDPGDVPEA